jgi:hypothetical protein
VRVRVAEARRLSFYLDDGRPELPGVEDEFAQLRLLREDVERRLALDLARTEANVELELLLQQLEGVARRGVVRNGGDLEGRRHGGRRDPECAAVLFGDSDGRGWRLI